MGCPFSYYHLSVLSFQDQRGVAPTDCWNQRLKLRLQIKGVFPCLVRWAFRAGSRDFCSALAALVSPVQNIFVSIVYYFNQRELRGGPLLTVETEVNGNSKSTNEMGPSLGGSMGFSCRFKRFLFCLGCSSQPSTKYFFLAVHFGRKPWWVACL